MGGSVGYSGSYATSLINQKVTRISRPTVAAVRCITLSDTSVLVVQWIERRSREAQSSVIKFIVAVWAEVDKVYQGVYLCDGGGGRKG